MPRSVCARHNVNTAVNCELCEDAGLRSGLVKVSKCTFAAERLGSGNISSHSEKTRKGFMRENPLTCRM